MQSISQAKRQELFLKSGFLDMNGTDVDKLKPFTGDAITTALYNVAAMFVENANKNLNTVDRVASGKLGDSIVPTEVVVMGKVYSIGINVNDYYKFVDQGVKGWQSGQPGSSPFAFKAPNKKGGAPKNSKMVAAIKQWLLKEGLKSAGGENKHPISAREGRRKGITDATTSRAIVVTMNIKKHGLKRTNFWGMTAQQINDYVVKELELALQIDIINSLTNGNSSK